MAKNTLTLNNAPKAKGKSVDTTDITEQKHAADAMSEELAKLEGEVAKPAPQTAAQKLGEFRLTHLAKALLDKACVNVSENTGSGLEDPVARDTAGTIAGIFADCGHDLSKVIDFTMEAMGEDAQAALTFIYKECYSVQKALNFIGNMAYRRALDPKQDFDLEQFVDYREDEREAPYGLEPLGTWDDERGADHAGPSREDHELIFEALEDLHVYLQLITEAYGWEAVDISGRDNSMPYMYVMEPDETFRRIYGLEECLDIMEVKYKESRAKRAAKQLEGLQKIQKAAREALKRAAK